MLNLDGLADAQPDATGTPWGWEWSVSAPGLRVRRLTVKDGEQTGLTLHQRRDRTVFVLRGNGRVKVYGEPHEDGRRRLVNSATWLEPGVRVRPGDAYRIIGPAEAIEVSNG